MNNIIYISYPDDVHVMNIVDDAELEGTINAILAAASEHYEKFVIEDNKISLINKKETSLINKDDTVHIHIIKHEIIEEENQGIDFLTYSKLIGAEFKNIVDAISTLKQIYTKDRDNFYSKFGFDGWIVRKFCINFNDPNTSYHRKVRYIKPIQKYYLKEDELVFDDNVEYDEFKLGFEDI